MVVMDSKDYRNKALSLLGDSNTYKTITKDPTTKFKYKLSQTLRDIITKEDSVITVTGKSTPPVQLPLNFMVFPKYIKLASPSDLLFLVGGPSHMEWLRSLQTSFTFSQPVPTPSQNTQHFVQHIKEVKLEQGEVMTSCNVKALFTSDPMDPSNNIVQPKLQQDPLLPQRTNMSIQQIVTPLEFPPKNTHFLF